MDKLSEADTKKRSASGDPAGKKPKKAKTTAGAGVVMDPDQVQINRRAEAASRLANSTSSVRLPPPDTLRESVAYGEAALNLLSVSFPI